MRLYCNIENSYTALFGIFEHLIELRLHSKVNFGSHVVPIQFKDHTYDILNGNFYNKWRFSRKINIFYILRDFCVYEGFELLTDTVLFIILRHW